MSSKYEIVNGRLEVRGYAELFETRDASADDTVEKMCPGCGVRYTREDLRDLLDKTGSSAKCEDCDVDLVDADDEDDRSGRRPDKDIS